MVVVRSQSLVSLPDLDSLSESIKVDGVIAGHFVPASDKFKFRKELANVA